MVDASERRAGRWWRVGVGLLVSSAALAGLVLGEGPGARAEAVRVVRALRADRQVPAAAASPLTVVASQPNEHAPAKRAAVLDEHGKVVGGRVEQGLVGVPDFVGMRLGAARREARKLGIKLSARDEYGERVPAEVAHQFRVRKQDLAAGSALAPGATIALRVRMLPMYAMGY